MPCVIQSIALLEHLPLQNTIILETTLKPAIYIAMLLDSFSQHNSVPKFREKGKAKQETLDKIPLEIQEAMILEDLLYVLLAS